MNQFKDREIVDIGGKHMAQTLAKQVSDAFLVEGCPFPKELAYTVGMDEWTEIAKDSHQTTDEMDIIKSTCKAIVEDLPSNTYIIDLGAADSRKYEPYVQEFIRQRKTCTYVPLDINKESLEAQIKRAKEKFPQLPCVGLWGNFKNGDDWYHNISSPRLFLSCGSIFFNAPDEIAKKRCRKMKALLNPSDRLIVGQDAPAKEGGSAHDHYQTDKFGNFFYRCLEGVNKIAGIKAPATVWNFESRMVKGKHYFLVTAKEHLICTNLNDFPISPGREYEMFPSWKLDETNIKEIANEEGLAIEKLDDSQSTMHQYRIQTQKASAIQP
ncbi:hypothetical protein G7046_g4687 [Stylonectria norvegica]|nr:hypothetical protein G7046_g4687 [Stylonectria norvegica]